LLKIFKLVILSGILFCGVYAQTGYEVQEDSYNIAVLLPFTDKGKPYLERRSYQVLEGIKYAVHLHNKTSDKKIGLFIRDTRADSSWIAELKKEVQHFRNLKGIIGSTTSQDSKDLISVFADMGLPIISPTATDETLPQLAPVVLQANPAFSTRGKIMANFARNFQGNSRIGIIYNKDGYSALLAESFKEEFERLGGKVTFTKTYTTKELRDEKLKSMVKDVDKASDNIDGLYIPISDVNHAHAVSDQFEELVFTKHVYGNQDWLLSDIFGNPAPFLSAIYVDSDYFVDISEPGYQKLNTEFYGITRFLFDRNPLYGYDAATMFIKLLEKNNFDTSALMNEIAGGTDHDGLKGKIVFDARRTNLSLNILQYTLGRFSLFFKLKI